MNILKYFLLISILYTFLLYSDTPRLDKAEKNIIKTNILLDIQKTQIEDLNKKITEVSNKLENIISDTNNHKIINKSQKDNLNNIIKIKTDSFDKRISDINFNINLLASIIGLFGTIVAGLGIYSIWASRQKFTEQIKTWMDHNSESVKSDIKDIIDNVIDEEIKKIKNAAIKELHKFSQFRRSLKLKYSNKLDSKDTEDSSIRNTLEIADIYVKLGKLKAALSQYDRILEKDKNNFYALFNKAVVLFDMEEYDEAIELFEKIKEKDDEVYYNLGLCYSEKASKSNEDKSSLYKKSIDYIKKAIELKGDEYDYFYAKGYIYTYLFDITKKEEDYKSAIKAYEKAIELNPKFDDSYTNILELQLINSKEFDIDIETKYKKLFSSDKDVYIKYEILNILKCIRDEKEINIDNILNNYKDICLSGWTYEDIDNWILNYVGKNDIKDKLSNSIKKIKETISDCNEN